MLLACLVLMAAPSIPRAGGAPKTPDAETSSAENERPPLSERWRRGWRNAGDDALYLVTFPSRPSKKGVAATIGVLAGIGVLMIYDQQIRDEVQEARDEALEEWESYLEPMGRATIDAAVIGMVYLGGRLAKDEQATETGRALAEAVSMTNVTMGVEKWTWGRTRPSDDLNAGQFFEGGTSFPSGHASRAFAIATVLAERHGKVAAWIAYPLATLVGLARLENDKHWASDVLAGAALGYGISKAIVRRRAERAERAAQGAAPEPRSTSSPTVSMTPVFSPEKRAVGISLRFAF